MDIETQTKIKNLVDALDNKGVASEATLQDILGAIGGTGSSVKSGLGEAGVAAKRTAKTFLDFGEETEKTKKSTINLDKTFRATGIGMTVLGGGMHGLTRGLEQASYHLDGFSEMILSLIHI